MPGPAPEASPPDYKRRRSYEHRCEARALNFACFHDQTFLISDRARRWFADAFTHALVKHAFDLWAYCIMPTHAHILVYPRGEPDVSALLASAKTSVTVRATRWVKAHAPSFLDRMRDEQPDGTVAYRFWQRGGGYGRNLHTPKAIWDMIDYIHMNPVEARLAQRSCDWNWSSALWYANRTPGPLTLNVDRVPPRP